MKLLTLDHLRLSLNKYDITLCSGAVCINNRSFPPPLPPSRL